MGLQRMDTKLRGRASDQDARREPDSKRAEWEAQA
jgi:hypothetical protein